MSNNSHLNHAVFNKKGVGTIIGGAFILLAFTSIVTFLYMYTNLSNEMNEVYMTSAIIDHNKALENINAYNIELKPNGSLNISIINNGHVMSSILYIGEKSETSNQNYIYHSCNLVLNPGERSQDIIPNQIIYDQNEEKNIQIITKFGNIFTFTYPVESDTTDPQTIYNIFQVGPPFYPFNYNLLGETINIYGNIDNIYSDDGKYIELSSYTIYNKNNNYPDNNISNVDGIDSIGNHNIFQNMQYGLDSIFDRISEQETKNHGAKHYIKPTTHTDSNNKWNDEQNAYDINNITFASSSRNRVMDNIYWRLFNNTNKGTISKVDLYIRIDVNFITISGGTDSITLQWWVGASQGLGTYIIDSNNDGSDLIFSFLNLTEPNDGEWSWSDISDLQIRQVGGQNGPLDTVAISTGEVWGMVTTYAQELDLEVQFTNVEYNLDNEELCIFIDDGGTESIKVDVWHSSTWNSVFSGLTSGWNNATISDYLDNPLLTLRLRDSYVQGDSVQSGWDIDVVLLSMWDNTSKERVAVEYTGICNVSNFTRVYLNTDINSNVSSVLFEIQLYDYQSLSYSSYGDGYLSYISSGTPNTDEKSKLIILEDSEKFVNASGNWQVKITGTKAILNKFSCNLDLVEFEPFYMLSGKEIGYDEWTSYGFKASNSNGDPIKYGYFSLYHNSTNVLLRDTTTQQPLSNPELLLLDVNGEYYFDLKSRSIEGEYFTLGFTLGDRSIENQITQTMP